MGRLSRKLLGHGAQATEAHTEHLLLERPHKSGHAGELSGRGRGDSPSHRKTQQNTEQLPIGSVQALHPCVLTTQA